MFFNYIFFLSLSQNGNFIKFIADSVISPANVFIINLICLNAVDLLYDISKYNDGINNTYQHLISYRLTTLI